MIVQKSTFLIDKNQLVINQRLLSCACSCAHVRVRAMRGAWRGVPPRTPPTGLLRAKTGRQHAIFCPHLKQFLLRLRHRSRPTYFLDLALALSLPLLGLCRPPRNTPQQRTTKTKGLSRINIFIYVIDLDLFFGSFA
jgi:hypothetical protein